MLHVVQLVEVVEYRLPVAVEQHGLIGDQRHARQVVRDEPLDHRPDELLERRSVRVGAHEHQTECSRHPNRLERSLRTVDGLGEPLVVGHHHEASVRAEGPTVVGAGVVIRTAVVVDEDARPPVLTDVVVRGELTGLGTRDDDRFPAEVPHHVLAGSGDVALQAGELPQTGPELLELAPKLRLRRVPLGGDGLRCGHRPVHHDAPRSYLCHVVPLDSAEPNLT